MIYAMQFSMQYGVHRMAFNVSSIMRGAVYGAVRYVSLVPDFSCQEKVALETKLESFYEFAPLPPSAGIFLHSAFHSSFIPNIMVVFRRLVLRNLRWERKWFRPGVWRLSGGYFEKDFITLSGVLPFAEEVMGAAGLLLLSQFTALKIRKGYYVGKRFVTHRKHKVINCTTHLIYIITVCNKNIICSTYK